MSCGLLRNRCADGGRPWPNQADRTWQSPPELFCGSLRAVLLTGHTKRPPSLALSPQAATRGFLERKSTSSSEQLSRFVYFDRRCLTSSGASPIASHLLQFPRVVGVSFLEMSSRDSRSEEVAELGGMARARQQTKVLRDWLHLNIFSSDSRLSTVYAARTRRSTESAFVRRSPTVPMDGSCANLKFSTGWP
jgi:hypothetical protein